MPEQVNPKNALDSTSDKGRTDNSDLIAKREATRIIARRRVIGRIYGIFVIVEGALGLIAFGLVLQLWAQETWQHRVEVYGSAYDFIYEVESTSSALLAILCLLIIMSGIGLLKRERWAIYCTRTGGLVMFVMSCWLLLVRNSLWRGIEESFSRNIPSLITKVVLILVVTLPLIVPPHIPAIRDSTVTGRRRRRVRPYVG